MGRNNLTSDRMMLVLPVKKLIRGFSGPAMLAGTAGSLIAVCDAIFLGRVLGVAALAAMAMTVPVILILNAFSSWMNSGVAPRLAVYYSNGDKKSAGIMMVNNIFMNLAASIVACVLCYLLVLPMFHLFGASWEIVEKSQEYLRIYLAGTFFSFSSSSLFTILHTIGKPKESMAAQMGTVLINFVLDIVFIFGMDMGMAGAALGTVLAQACSWVYLIIRFHLRRTELQIRKSCYVMDREFIRYELSFGRPSFINILGSVVIAVLINETLVNLSASDPGIYLACYAIYRCLSEIFIRMISGLTTSLVPLFSVNINKKRYARVKEILVKSILLVSVILVTAYFVLCFTPDSIAWFFGLDEQMKDITVRAIRIGLCTLPFVGSQMVILAYFRSVGRSGLGLSISLSRQMLVLAPLLLLLPYVYGETGVWWSLCFADMASIIYSWYALLVEVRKLGVE